MVQENRLAVVARAADRTTSPYLTRILDSCAGHCQAYTVFVDIVSYTERKTVNQMALINRLQTAFDKALGDVAHEFKEKISAIEADIWRDTIIVPLGDGAAIAFPFHNLFEAPLFFAKKLYEYIYENNVDCQKFKRKGWCDCHQSNISLRCGISFGDAILFRDLNGMINISGTSVNMAARVMGVANPSQIFLTQDVEKKFLELKAKKEKLRKYIATVKHGKRIDAFHYVEKHGYLNVNKRGDLEEADVARDASGAAPLRADVAAPKVQQSKRRQQPRLDISPEMRQALTELRERMLPVAPGDFIMGDAAYGRFSARISRRFLIDRYPVTQRLYKAVMHTNPSAFPGDDRPVETVSWFDAVNFCIELSKAAGLSPVYTTVNGEIHLDLGQDGYRLPTEAEWEYCCVQDEDNFGAAKIQDIAWCRANSEGGTKDVGRMRRGGSLLADMLGNVWEWCNDRYHGYPSAPQLDYCYSGTGSERIVRGGAWDESPDTLNPRYRFWRGPLMKENKIGFRLVCNQSE